MIHKLKPKTGQRHIHCPPTMRSDTRRILEEHNFNLNTNRSPFLGRKINLS